MAPLLTFGGAALTAGYAIAVELVKELEARWLGQYANAMIAAAASEAESLEDASEFQRLVSAIAAESGVQLLRVVAGDEQPGLRILVAVDSPVNRKVIEAMLAKHGHSLILVQGR